MLCETREVKKNHHAGTEEASVRQQERIVAIARNLPRRVKAGRDVPARLPWFIYLGSQFEP